MIKEAIVKIVNKEDLTYDKAYTGKQKALSTSFQALVSQAHGVRSRPTSLLL